MATVPDPLEQRREQMFGTLAPAQLARIAPLGARRPLRQGEVLYDQGDRDIPFYVVLRGRLEVVRPHDAVEDAIIVLGPGQFTGEMNMLTGRRSLVCARAMEDGEVLEVRAEALRALVQVDSELSELLMRAFILRRMSLIARGMGDVVLVGSHHSSSTLRLKEFLIRNFGDADLVLDSVTTSCGCTVAEGYSKVVKPGASTHLQVSLQTRTSVGKIQKSVLIKSNDATKGLYELKLEAIVAAPDTK